MEVIFRVGTKSLGIRKSKRLFALLFKLLVIMVVDNVRLGSKGFHPSITVLGHEISELNHSKNRSKAHNQPSTFHFLPSSSPRLVRFSSYDKYGACSGSS